MSEGTIKDWMDHDECGRLREAIQKIRKKVQWKPGKDAVHLKKRQALKHLPSSASLSDYEKMVHFIVGAEDNALYLYDFKGSHYYAVRGFAQDREWLVIFGQGGVMETAFPPEETDDYLERRGFVFLGRLGEVLKWIE